MAIINSYPTITPTGDDLILIVDTSKKNNPTKTATVNSIASLASGATYDLTGQLDGASEYAINLTGSDGSLDKVKLLAGANITLTDSGSNSVTIDAAGASGMTSWNLTGDNATVSTISNSDTVDIQGGTKITTAAALSDTLTINHDSTNRFDTTSTASPAAGGTFTVIDSISQDSTGHVEAVNVKTVTLPASGGGATFTSANSEAGPHIVLGADAKANAPTGGSDGVYICATSFGSATNNDEQINIGRDNDTNGTQSVAIGINNSATTSSPYGLMFGKDNTTAGTRTWAFGEGNNMGTTDTASFGKNNTSTFTGSVSSGGLMNLSLGSNNSVDCDKAIVLGWSNDISGSLGWTIGSGKEVVVLGTRFSDTLLGPNRSSTDRSGPRVIIGTGSQLNSGLGEIKKNSVEYYSPDATHSGVYHPALYNSASYADDAAASAGGVGLGELYRNGNLVQIRMT